WGQLQLNREFFGRVFQTMSESVEMVIAERAGKVIGGAFNLTAHDRLYGRYWGCFEEHPFLHFNVCFYQSIDDCIRAGRRVFEPGAGGEHKIARGFQPSAIHSLHRIFHPKLDRAVRDFVAREGEEVADVVGRGAEISGMKPWVPPVP
ncbi:MAG TPA: GNAT family N-acetyltransferase, partial [Myxococcaceae bacterium]|nr:GNAT family N-acetyltransferase [Myxococcaceae bacterium]